MTKTGEAARPPMELDTDSLLDTIRLKQREISLAAAAVIVIAGGTYLWRESVARKDERADRALNTASSSYYAGNKALAQSDLEKMTDRYSGTAAGVQGAMLLSQILFEAGKWDEGIKRLEGAKSSSAARPFSASIEALIGGAFADQKKYDDAAKRYSAAADLAPFSADKDLYRAEAARVLALAGKSDDARKIWAEISLRLDSPAFGEAKVRLGELEAVAPIRP
jgi:predicted negative regulator of RcsB-dependent stress response